MRKYHELLRRGIYILYGYKTALRVVLLLLLSLGSSIKLYPLGSHGLTPVARALVSAEPFLVIVLPLTPNQHIFLPPFQFWLVGYRPVMVEDPCRICRGEGCCRGAGGASKGEGANVNSRHVYNERRTDSRRQQLTKDASHGWLQPAADLRHTNDSH